MVKPNRDLFIFDEWSHADQFGEFQEEENEVVYESISQSPVYATIFKNPIYETIPCMCGFYICFLKNLARMKKAGRKFLKKINLDSLSGEILV